MIPFINVKDQPIESSVPKGTSWSNFSSVGIGSGSNVFRADQSGMWLGAGEYASAPFRVDMEGNTVLTSATVSGNIDASSITSGTLSTSRIPNLSADKITSGYISSDRIEADSISASKLDVDNLSSISANMGTLTAGSITGGSITGVTITGVTITGSTITGGTIRTAASGKRVELSSTYNDIYLYSSTGLAGRIFLDGSALSLEGDSSNTDTMIQLYDDTAFIYNNLKASGWGSFGGDLDMNSHNIKEVATLYVNDIDDNGQGYVEIKDDLDVDGWLATGSWASLGGNLDMNSHSINEVDNINYACDVYSGTTKPENIVLSVKAVSSSSSDWSTMDHTKLHKSIKSTWVKDKVVKDKDGNLSVVKENKTGYSLNKLVMVQNAMLADLLERVKVLEKGIK